MRRRVVALLVGILPAALAAQVPATAPTPPRAPAAPADTSSSPPLASFDSAWASISRTYFDTALVAGRWRVTSDSLRGTLGASPSLDQVRGAIRALIAVPGQSHFALIPRDAVPTTPGSTGDGRPGTVGLDLRMIGDTLVAWRVDSASAAARAGIRPGDIITHIDTLPIAAVRRRLDAAFPDDARQARLLVARVAAQYVSRTTGDTARVRVVGRRGAARQLTLVHEPLAGTRTRFGNLPPMVLQVWRRDVAVGRGARRQTIPVIHWSGWFPSISGELDRLLFEARDARAVIIDLRGNPGGAVGMIGGVAGHFADSAINLGTMYGRGSTLYLRANPRVVDPTGTRRPVITAPMAILVDAFTASSSEFFAAGMQALGRAQVFGEPSAGMALPALMLRLPSGDVLMHPIADHEDASGRRVEGVGVLPDVATPLTRRALRDGRDPALDAARAWLARRLSR